MADYVIWMDSEKAQIFALKTTGIEKTHLQKHGADHHSHNKKDHNHDATVDRYYMDLARHIQEAQHILILGPGLAKNHFRSHLESHHPKNLATKVVGLENSDHPSEKQILAEARKFYKTYDLFNSPIKATN